MLSSLVRAVEPYFKVLSRSASPWKGHHIVHSDLQRAAIPWGFVSQQKVLESVTPDRTGGKVETSAGELNLDTWEFLRGTEEAYRCVARLFAPLPPPTPPLPLTPPLTASTSASTCSRRHDEGGDTSHKRDRISNGSNISDRGDRSRSGGMGRSGAIDESGGIDRSSGVGRSGGTDDSDRSDRINNTSGGVDGSGGIDVERYRQHLAGVSRGSASAADTVGRSATTRGKPDRAGIPTAVAPPPTDFLDFDIASPQMSMFLNDVLESYQTQGLVPRLSVSTVTARLCNVGVRLGGISKNTNFLGLASADELKYHLTMGMLGPEGAVINELEGRAPQRVIAEVELTCEEEFVLENEAGEVLHRPEARGPKVHFVTFQSNIGEGTTLEWQITNINDVIKPTFAYYFSRFGH